MASVQEATARTNARIAAKKAGTVDRGALDKLAAQTGGKAQYDKGRVEYQVKGNGYKATRYARPGETPNMEAKSSRPGGKGEVNAPVGPEAMEPEVDTGQPSPENVDAQPFTGASPMQSYEQATQALSAGGLSGDTLAQARSIVDSKYQKAHQQLTSSGTPPPADGGAAMAQVYSATPYEADKTAMNAIFDQDPVINGIMQEAFTFLQPQERKTSLMDDYKKLYRSSGLDEINEELIDAETVLDGTEDDIRNEIQTAGGFGTESQVQAMTLARNKGLLKRYNQLFAMKESAQKQLDTMMTINQQDRQMASQEAQNRLNTMFKLADFRQQAQRAYQETARFNLQTLGADGMYNSLKGDPTQLARYEKIMGLPAGGLATAASQAALTRANEQELTDLKIGAASLDYKMKKNEYEQSLLPTPAGQIPANVLNSSTEAEKKGLGFLNRAINASDTLTKLEEEGFNFGQSKQTSEAWINPMGVLGFKSEGYLSYKQAAQDWIKSVLRLESGATIPPDEEKAYFETFFPKYGDNEAIRQQKAQARAEAEDFLSTLSGRLAPYADQRWSPEQFYD